MKNKGNNNRRTIRATLFFVLLFFSLFSGLKALAAETVTLRAEDIEVDYTNEVIAVRANQQEKLYIGFAGGGKSPKAYQRLGLGQVAEYAGKTVSGAAFYIDISAQSMKSDTVFYAKYAEGDEAVCVTLRTRSKLKAVHNGLLPDTEEGKIYAAQYAATQDKLKLYPGFCEETGYLTFQKDNKVFTELADIEWRADVVMKYKELGALDMKMYQSSGATLYFRINNGDEPISKEAKVKVRKPAKAPTVKIDGTKLTIALKDTQQYRIIFGDGSYTNWQQPAKGTKQLAIAKLTGIRGDGISTAFEEAVIQIRTAATLKNVPSRSFDVYLDMPDMPEDGQDGLSVKAVNPSDIEKGLIVTNGSSKDYQFAVADSNAWECNGNVTKLIATLDFTAKKGAKGVLTWKTVKAGKTAKVSYSAIKDCEDSYVVLYRLAPVKEDKATAVREFRVASVVMSYGGIAPNPSLKSQAFLMTGEQLTKSVSFDKVEGHTLYVSVDGGEFTKNTNNSVSFTGTVGKTILIEAYLLNDKTNKAGSIVTLRYSFVADGELEAYANDWGYQHCKEKGDDWAATYQRAYLATVMYQPSFSVEGISLTLKEIVQVIKMIRMDNPEIIQLGNRYTLRGNELILSLGDKDEMNELLAECEKKAKAAIKEIEQKYGEDVTPIEYVKGIHDFIVLEKQYKSSAMDQTMVGVLCEQYTPVCASYALAFQYLCEMAGIQSVAIHGDAANSSGDNPESHMWNMVNLGDKIDYTTMKTEAGDSVNPEDWYEIDVTWNDPVGGQEDYVRYTYFNLTTDEMNEHSSGTKHIRSSGQAYDSYPVEKCTGTTYNYDYLVENNYVTAE